METPTSGRFLRACRRQPVDTTPIWMMRQAGRCIPAYRELRSRYSFAELVGQPELMTRVTLMPLAELDVDAAVLFADIMLPLAALRVGFEIVETIGPVIADPVSSRERVDALARDPVAEAVPSVPETIRLVQSELAGRVPVIGFSGAPFTLACYLVEGKPSRDFSKPKALMFSDPGTWHALMERLTDLVIEYLTVQVEAGVDVVQLFDSWLGVLSPQDVERFVLPYTIRIFDAISGLGVPTISFGTNTGTFLELVARADCDVVSVDWRVPLDDAWRRIGHDRGIQGNLDPSVLFGGPEVVRERAADVLRRAEGRPGHIFNLGHGVLPGTPLDNLKVLVDTVHELGSAR